MFIYAVLFIYSAFSYNNCSNTVKMAKEALFLNNSIKTAKKYSKLAIKQCGKRQDIRNVLDFMDEYLDEGMSYLYKLCRTKLNDCSFWKAKIYKTIGNVSIAKNIYRKNGLYFDYLLLVARQEKDPSKYREYNYLTERQKQYVVGLKNYSVGNWKAVYTKLKVYNLASLRIVFLSLLNDGNLLMAKKQLHSYKDNAPETIFVKRLLYAILLYAENQQIESEKLLKDFLLYKPNDYLAQKYLAQIYYRTGYFSKAENIYNALLEDVWQYTERFYLLREKIIMRILYGRYAEFKKLLLKTISEYPNRLDLVQDSILKLVERLQFKMAREFLKYLKPRPAYYYATLAYIKLYSLDIQGAILSMQLAYKSEKSLHYKQLLKVMRDKQKTFGKFTYDCSHYKIRKLKRYIYEVRRRFDSVSSKYYINYQNRTITVPVYYKYAKLLNIKPFVKEWEKNIKRFWSIGKYKLRIVHNKVDTNLINVQAWPSSFYNKRVSIDDWVLLMSPRVAVHEFGHLLGLDDEYIEYNTSLTKKITYVSSMESIMRNAVSGRPMLRHINLITGIPRVCNEL